MTFKNVREQLNIKSQCKKYELPLWQCPQFLFLVMGIIIVVIIIISYLIASRQIEDPEVVVLIVLFSSVVLVIIDYIIIHSFERLADVARAKMEFISVITHQLRSPITNIKYSLETIITDKLTDKDKKEYFKILRDNIKRMGGLVDNILTVSRISLGELKLRKEKISMGDLVKRIVSGFKSRLETSGLTLKFEKGEELPEVFSDPSWLSEVVKNLLDNAIRYQKGKGIIKIVLRRQGKNIYFQISDSGIGIPEGDQKYIFQKFFRAKNARRYQTGGTGLGLYIVKEIVKKMKGKVGFKSQEDKGTTFWFTLPIK